MQVSLLGVKSIEMGDCRGVSPAMFAAIVTLFLLSNCFALGRAVREKDLTEKRLTNYSEIHEAKSLIDALSSKLYLNLQTYQNKYEYLKQQSNEYLKQSGLMQGEIKVLNKLKGLLNGITKVEMNPVCEKFFINFDFTASRKITINSSVPLAKDFTVSVAVNHRDLIDRKLALSNGNDLRVYFLHDEGCQPREIDRIVENIATTKTTVLFKLQEDLLKTVSDGSAYFLVYGNKDAGKAKSNPGNVYLFYDDFSDSNIEKNWQKQWGSISVENGLLKVRTGKTPTGEFSEIAVFVKHGQEWKDIEVELDFNEKNNKAYPGPFLRVQDPRLKSTTAWWFEYGTTRKLCTMRPYQNNVDGKWFYKGTLTKTLSSGSWTHAKYRIVGDRFSHWVNNHIIHNNVKVASKWFISKGTFGLGCHTNSGATNCDTSYDNIRITKYVPVMPTVSLGAECKVDLRKFYELGASQKNPATSCKQIHDISLYGGKHRLKNGVYWIKTSAESSAPTYCDLANGGWTLIGKVGGFVNKLYKFWLIKNSNLDALNNPALPSKVGCIDARYLATYHASTIMFSSGEKRDGIGSKWVRWALPEGRETDSLWTHSVGRRTVSKAKMYHVIVTAWNGREEVCYQNKYGIMPLRQHGGSYPSATYNRAGNTRTKDICMAIGVLKWGRNADGWTQNANGYDSPRSNSDWPNSRYNHQSPYATVWLK